MNTPVFEHFLTAHFYTALTGLRHNRWMQAFYSDRFVLPLPPGHRFPMEKYQMLRDELTLHVPQVRMLQAPEATEGELALVHDPAYIQAIGDGSVDAKVLREIGFPWSLAMAARARRSVGGTVAAGRSAMLEGIAANLAGGTHHSYAHKGGGFCVFNDLAVTARVLQTEWARRHGLHYPGLKVAIVDLDVHQGNGTASIFRNDPSVFTVSLHGDKNFPFRKEDSDLDVALPDGCTDAPYLEALDHALQTLEDRFDAGVVLYLAGADPHEGDRLGRLKLTNDGMQARDRRVFDWCFARRLPCVFAMGGGYGTDIRTTVQVQRTTYCVAVDYWQRWNTTPRPQQVGT